MKNIGPPTTASPSLHYRACENCARAKAKCTRTHLGGKCYRCERLNKQCQPAVSVRKQRTARKASTHAATRLEEKLDGLVSLLRSGAQPNSQITAQPDAHPTLHPTTGGTTGGAAAELQQSPLSTALGGHSGSVPGYLHPTADEIEPNHHVFQESPDINPPNPRTGRLSDKEYNKDALVHPPSNFFKCGRNAPPSSVSTAYHTPDGSNINDSHPSVDEAETLLNVFQTQMLAYFPFMKMPAYSSSHQFHAEHPFLWLCIMAVTSKSTEQQLAFGKEVRLSLGRKMLLESERSLDLLFGILVFTAWAQSHVHTNPIVTNLLQLAIGLLGDLGLNKPPATHPLHMMLNYDARGCPRSFNPPKRTMEERRAALGLFWLSSVISTYFQRVDSLRWTPYLEECLGMLAEIRECSKDLVLCSLVRLQLLVENVNEVSCQEYPGESERRNLTPLKFCMQSLLTQLDEIKRKMPPELQQNEVLLLHMYNTELSIHEIVLSTGPATLSAHDFKRTESLFACLRAIRGWSELILEVPAARYVAFSMSIFTQIAHCVITLYRLLTFESADWDISLAKETVDWSALLGSIIGRMKQVKSAAGLDGPENLDVYHTAAQRLHTIKEWCDAKMAAEVVPLPSSTDAREEGYIDQVDDAWLKDILGMEDYQFESYLQPF